MNKHRFSSERRADFCSEMLNLKKSIYGDNITDSNRYHFGELRYRLREFVKTSDDLESLGYQYVVIMSGIEFVYKLSACGLCYVGRTNDPFQRLVSHICSSDNSAMIVVETAIDNMVVPDLEVIDICDTKSVTAVEAYWIDFHDCVNVQEYPHKLKDITQNPENFRCVVARKNLGVQPYLFEKLIVKKKGHEMAKIQMIVDGELFPSKKKLTERCQKILHDYKINETLPENETRFLTSLIESYHPEGELKIGCGIQRMWVGLNEYGGKGFYLERHDGSSTDWSFMKSINNPSKWHDFHAACRNAVMDQTIEYKMQRFNEERCIHCCLTGEQLFVDTAHTDHAPPRTFDALLKVFLRQTGIDYNTIQIEPTYDNKVGCWLSDGNFAKRWADFHRLNAKFRLVSRLGNLSNSKREMNALLN